MIEVFVLVVNGSSNPLPTYAHDGDSGVDLCARIEDPDGIWLYPHDTKIIPTGLFAAVPDGFEVQIRSRSGLAAKSNIFVLNSPGTIDSTYRNEWGVILRNEGLDRFLIKNGDRIAQAVLCPVLKIKWVERKSRSELSETDRNLGGFGSSGV